MVEMAEVGHQLVWMGWQSIRIVGASACVIFNFARLHRACNEKLNELAGRQSDCFTWVPEHTGILGNEQADRLAWQASSQTFIRPEPALLISHTVVQMAIRDWAYKQSDKHWQSLMTCQQAKEMITGRCRRREMDLQALTGQMLRPVVGILTGHTQV